MKNFLNNFYQGDKENEFLVEGKNNLGAYSTWLEFVSYQVFYVFLFTMWISECTINATY